ncbi:MAG: phosphopantetheine-binding protein [Deltaproteobacteria bacterium]|jgi:acyl carrier protein|nr:phosphopantetheine-binding protein [Deltaproteobacteria bacterium]
MDTRTKLKQAMVEDLHLEDIAPEDIDDDAPLFGEGPGLGLDSLDAIEIVVLVQRRFGLDMQDAEAARDAFSSITALAAYIDRHGPRG